MTEWLSEIKVIIFDMDGTLYQEDTFMDRYIRYLLEGTEWEVETDAAVAEARKILTGQHPVKFGHFYHKQDDLVLVQEAGKFVQAFTWEGRVMEGQVFAERYGQLSLGDPCHQYIGDPWGIVGVIGLKYDIPEDKRIAAFDRVRQEMLFEPYQFDCHSELFQAIQQLDGVKKVLMTNSSVESGIQFLQYMQILHHFDEIYCDAGKPIGMRRYLESLMEGGYHPREILSVGDNPWNDLYPVKQRGGRTCFISPYPSVDDQSWDLRLRFLDELAALMRAMQKPRTKAIHL